jgi:hypothetical protein
MMMDLVQMHGGDSEAALKRLKQRFASLMEQVDMKAISAMDFRALGGIFRHRKLSELENCKTTLLSAVDDAIFEASAYHDTLQRRVSLETRLQQLEQFVLEDLQRMSSLRKVIAILDHTKCWILLWYVEQLAHDDIEDVGAHFFVAYKEMAKWR